MIRNILKSDYNGYISLLGACISNRRYDRFLDTVLGDTHVILVVEVDKTIVGTGTLFIEEKMTYGGCKMGHVENVLVKEEYRRRGLGEELVARLVDMAKEAGCYRVDLNCKANLEHFYGKNGFIRRGLHMSTYIKENMQ